MRRINRAQLRGKPLDEDCKQFGRSESCQFGPDDRRCFCSGIWDRMRDEYLRKCITCPAWNSNATPINEGEEEYKNHISIY